MQEKIKEFGKYLLVQKGLGRITIKGYCETVKRVTRQLNTPTPTVQQIYDYIDWMYSKNYSYSYLVNTSLALEWYMKYIGSYLKLGRPKKPKTIVKNTFSLFQAIYNHE